MQAHDFQSCLNIYCWFVQAGTCDWSLGLGCFQRWRPRWVAITIVPTENVEVLFVISCLIHMRDSHLWLTPLDLGKAVEVRYIGKSWWNRKENGTLNPRFPGSPFDGYRIFRTVDRGSEKMSPADFQITLAVTKQSARESLSSHSTLSTQYI